MPVRNVKRGEISEEKILDIVHSAILDTARRLGRKAVTLQEVWKTLLDKSVSDSEVARLLAQVCGGDDFYKKVLLDEELGLIWCSEPLWSILEKLEEHGKIRYSVIVKVPDCPYREDVDLCSSFIEEEFSRVDSYSRYIREIIEVNLPE